MQREEAREGVMSILRAADDDFLQARSNQRHDGGNVRRHLGCPIAFLVPRQQVAGERHAQHQAEQRQPEPEVHFARRFVGPVNHHLHQMQHQQHRHHMRRVMMQPAQQPAARHFVLDEINALPRRLRTGAVSHPEKNSRDELRDETKRQRAAPDVTPARAARNVFVQRLVRQLAEADAVIQPVEQAFHATGIFSALPAWKFWNFTQTSLPLRTSTSSESSARGDGLERSAIFPSAVNVLLWQGQRKLPRFGIEIHEAARVRANHVERLQVPIRQPAEIHRADGHLRELVPGVRARGQHGELARQAVGGQAVERGDRHGAGGGRFAAQRIQQDGQARAGGNQRQHRADDAGEEFLDETAAPLGGRWFVSRFVHV